jgi:hypothetical protein
MKKLFIITASVAMMSICSLVQAQDQDTTSSDLNTQPPVEESQQNQGNTQSDDMKTRDAERVDNQQPQPTDQELQNDVDAMQENFEGATIDKVGPNGEKLFMERGKYFYINDEGKKVKVKKSEVRDKSEMQPR